MKSAVCFMVWAVGVLMQHLFGFDVFDANLWYFYVAAILCAGIQYVMLWINISRGKHLHKICVIVYSLTVLSEAVQLVTYRLYLPYPIGLTVLCLGLDLCGLLLIVFLKNQAVEREKMTKKKVLSGFSDGLIQGLILCLLLMFTVSPFGGAVSIEGLLVISGALALLSPLSYYIMVVKSSRGKGLLALSAMSFLGFVLIVILFVLVPWGQMLIPNHMICFSAEMIWQYEMLVFLCVSMIFRLVLMIRKIKTKK